LSIAPQVTPTEKIQADFASKCAFVRQSTRAAVARAEPNFSQMSFARCAANHKAGAADAGLTVGRGHDDLHRFHLCLVDLFRKIGDGNSIGSIAASLVPFGAKVSQFGPARRFTQAL